MIEGERQLSTCQLPGKIPALFVVDRHNLFTIVEVADKGASLKQFKATGFQLQFRMLTRIRYASLNDMSIGVGPGRIAEIKCARGMGGNITGIISQKAMLPLTFF